MSSEPRETWYRVVDAHDQGWHPSGSLDGPTVVADQSS